MPRKKQVVQKPRRQKAHDPGSAEALHVKPRGVFRLFANYWLFAVIGAVVIAGGFLLTALNSGGRRDRGDDGSVRGEGVTRTTPEAGETQVAPAVIKTYSSPPELAIDTTKHYVATIKTDKGDVKVELLPAEAPETVNNFVFLANDHYYDGVTFHRVIQDFIAQAGDPTGTGIGGPGYSLPVESTDEAFDAGVLAMAKPQDASSDNNGSQFFVMLRDEPTFDGKFTVFGRVIEGMDVLTQLTARDPQLQQDPPPGDRIESITIEET